VAAVHHYHGSHRSAAVLDRRLVFFYGDDIDIDVVVVIVVIVVVVIVIVVVGRSRLAGQPVQHLV